MPIEVRELTIKTEIKTQPAGQAMKLEPQDIKALKQQIIDECLRTIKAKSQRDSFNR